MRGRNTRGRAINLHPYIQLPVIEHGSTGGTDRLRARARTDIVDFPMFPSVLKQRGLPVPFSMRNVSPDPLVINYIRESPLYPQSRTQTLAELPEDAELHTTRGTERSGAERVRVQIKFQQLPGWVYLLGAKAGSNGASPALRSSLRSPPGRRPRCRKPKLHY